MPEHKFVSNHQIYLLFM